MPAVDYDLTPVLLLSLLGFVLLTAALLVFFVLRVRARLAASKSEGSDAPTNPVAALPAGFYPSLLKRSNCWLAVKDQSLASVQKALALHDPQPCTWAEGVSVHGGQKLFVSPPVSGWVLVIGPALPDPGDDVDACFRFLQKLSHKLGQVQYFNLNPLLNHHAWAQLDFGHVIRAYAWAGETLWNQGPVTRAESELRMRCHDYAEAVGPASLGANETAARNTDQVHLLAARWSLDPEAIDERCLAEGWGIVGEPSRRF
jgi:hypothetical protein